MPFHYQKRPPPFLEENLQDFLEALLSVFLQEVLEEILQENFKNFLQDFNWRKMIIKISSRNYFFKKFKKNWSTLLFWFSESTRSDITFHVTWQLEYTHTEDRHTIYTIRTFFLSWNQKLTVIFEFAHFVFGKCKILHFPSNWCF